MTKNFIFKVDLIVQHRTKKALRNIRKLVKFSIIIVAMKFGEK